MAVGGSFRVDHHGCWFNTSGCLPAPLSSLDHGHHSDQRHSRDQGLCEDVTVESVESLPVCKAHVLDRDTGNEEILSIAVADPRDDLTLWINEGGDARRGGAGDGSSILHTPEDSPRQRLIP